MDSNKVDSNLTINKDKTPLINDNNELGLKLIMITAIIVYIILVIAFIITTYLTLNYFVGSVDSGNKFAQSKMEFYSNLSVIIWIAKALWMILMVIIARVTYPKSKLSKNFLKGYIIFIIVKTIIIALIIGIIILLLKMSMAYM